VAELSFKVDIDGKGFAKVSKLSGDFKKADSSAQKFSKALKASAKVAGAFALAAGGAAVGVGVFVTKTNKATVEALALSEALGLSANKAMALDTILKPVGLGAENVADLMEELNNKLGESKGLEALTPVKESLSILGLKFQEINKLKPEEQFQKITDSALKMKDAQQAAAAVDILMGGEANKVISILRQRGGSLDDIIEKQNRFNFLNKEAIEGAKNYIKNLGNLEMVFSTISKEISGLVGKVLNPFLDSLGELIAKNKDLIKTKIDQFIIKIKNVIGDLIQPVSAVIATFKGLSTVLFNIGQIVIDTVIVPFKNSILVIETLAEAIGKLIAGDFSGAKDLAGGLLDKVNDSITELGANTIQNVKDIGNAFTGIKSDYVGMASGLTIAFSQVNKGLDDMKRKQKEVAGNVSLGGVVAPTLTDKEKDDLKAKKERAKQIAELEERVRVEHREKTMNEFRLLEENEIIENTLRLALLADNQKYIEEQEAIHKANLAEIREKEAKHVEDMERKKQQANLASFNVYASTASNTIATMSTLFGKNKLLASAMVTIQGAQAVINTMATAPWPLNLATAALVGAQTAQSLAQINSTKAFALGGVVGGGEQMIRVNEQGQEAVLNASATRSLGRETIDLLNNGRADLLSPKGAGGDTYNLNVTGVATTEVFEQFEQMQLERHGNR